MYLWIVFATIPPGLCTFQETIEFELITITNLPLYRTWRLQVVHQKSWFLDWTLDVYS